MPVAPPRFRPAGMKASTPRPSWATTGRESRQKRGYGRAHELMRERVLIEEPLCRPCLAEGRTSATTIADHIVPKAEGGTDERDNYQGICKPCHKLKTAAESGRSRRR